MLEEFIEGYKRVTGGYSRLHGVTRGCTVLQGLTGVTRGYRGLQRDTGAYGGLQ